MDLAPVFAFGAAALAALYGLLWARPEAAQSWARSLTKTASVAGLALSGWVAGAPGLIVAGLALGALGDFALSRPGTRAFLAGMAAFAAGHLAYAVAFAAAPLLALLGVIGGQAWVPTGADIAAMGALVALLAATERWLGPHTGALRAPVRAYIEVIGLMAVAALVPAAPGGALLRLGVALFVLSDLMLALERFVVRAPAWRLLLARTLWPAYWSGQALILWSSLADPGRWGLIGTG